MATTLRRVLAAEREILANLLEKYAHDFSEFDQRDVNQLGLYDDPYLDYYFTEDNCWAYFIEVDGKLAGFVMVSDYYGSDSRVTDFGIMDFFVMRKYRRSGVGRRAFSLTLEIHKGRWRLQYHPKNTASVKFWNSVVSECSGGSYEEIHEYPGASYPDGSQATMIFFDNSKR